MLGSAGDIFAVEPSPLGPKRGGTRRACWENDGRGRVVRDQSDNGFLSGTVARMVVRAGVVAEKLPRIKLHHQKTSGMKILVVSDDTHGHCFALPLGSASPMNSD